MNLLAINKQGPELSMATPFEVFWGLDAPQNGIGSIGSNGDIYFRYSNTLETVYKKIEGVWVNTSSGGSTDSGSIGGGLSLSTPQNQSIMPAIEDNFQGIPTYLIDGNNVGVCVSFIIPSNFDELEYDLSINFPVLCGSLGANAIDLKVSLMQSGDTSPSDATESFPIEISPDVGMYKLLKLPIFPAFEQPLEAGMLCTCTLSSRSSGTQFASSWHFLKTGSFVSMEKK